MTSDDFNARVPSGTKVKYIPNLDGEAWMIAPTRGRAYTSGGDRAFVHVSGVRKPVPLTNIRILEPAKAMAR